MGMIFGVKNLNPCVEEEKWDLDMMLAEGGKYYNTIQLIAKVI
jgi:hypothetical protein